MHALSLHTVIVLLLALLGCTLEADKASAADEDGLRTATEEHDNSFATVFNTPESCWDAMLSAEANKDVAATLRCMAAEDRLAFLGSLVYRLDRLIARQAPLNEKATALLKRHGLEEVDIMGTLEKIGTPSATEGKTVFKAIGRKIKDQLAFAKEALELLAPVPKPDDHETPARRVLKLSNVIVSCDIATGVIVADGSLDGRPVYFVREEGSWRVSDNPTPTDSDAKNRAMP
jgi:hypothetical protein